ncbi:MAG: thioredoxin, partial [Planctomycetales bacterium]|nr:thioredoxin [Planctomycetales bacterium]
MELDGTLLNGRELDWAQYEGQVVLVDFWATWCGPCRALAPHVEAIAHEFDGKLKVVKLDIDTNPQTPSNYGVTSIPTLLLFKGGELVDKM